ncbi:hypothetical protein IC762_12270 [Bradyrhizobium genosp. L]|uniref:hypothetical protein n=1 Tax=Bradyrhizobium genosp. L TaxID=83637 RepID=UPI0018A27B60|nr:hypothetical protein [Bradyrhizobium genosp. L]QPF87020.1 hypothetical protein IC762_12270 [Bradyrhizobium genosp. L]
MSNTLSIDQSEWRVLFASSIARVNEFVNQNAALTPATLKAMHEHLDRAKLIASAWAASTPQAVPQEAARDMAEAPVEVQANGSAPPKRKGGWPAGKPRKRTNPQVVQ